MKGGAKGGKRDICKILGEKIESSNGIDLAGLFSFSLFFSHFLIFSLFHFLIFSLDQ